MEAYGHPKGWNPHISIKHKNGRKLEQIANEGDVVDLTITGCKYNHGTADMDIEVALEINNVNSQHVVLESLPPFAKQEFEDLDAFDYINTLTYDVHAVLRDGDDVVAFDDEGNPNDSTRVFTDSSCLECGKHVAADASYCPNCGAPQD